MPYIPEQHEKYKLLPYCCEHGGEVFEYPSGLLNKVNNCLPEGETLEPYGFESYEAYYSAIDKWIGYFKDNEEAISMLQAFRKEMLRLNCKESWSVLKYVGPAMDSVFGLTPGRYYYWPCSLKDLSYHGVIDDEEYTAYLHPTNADYWEIAEDPTGMASHVLSQNKPLWSQSQIDNIVDQFRNALSDWEK